MAGEIHDSLAQFFTGIAMQLGAAKEVFKAGSGNLRLTRKVFGEASACTLKIDAVFVVLFIVFRGNLNNKPRLLGSLVSALTRLGFCSVAPFVEGFI